MMPITSTNIRVQICTSRVIYIVILRIQAPRDKISGLLATIHPYLQNYIYISDIHILAELDVPTRICMGLVLEAWTGSHQNSIDITHALDYATTEFW